MARYFDNSHVPIGVQSIWNKLRLCRRSSPRKGALVSPSISPVPPQSFGTRQCTNADKSPSFNKTVCMSLDANSAFEELMMASYQAIATQDRPCPKLVDACDKTPGGCKCVRAGGDPGLPTGYVVRRVVQVERPAKWERYLKRKTEIRKRRAGGKLPKLDPPVLTEDAVLKHKDKLQPLDRDANEVYLWHGTPVRAALAIATDGFDMDLAGRTSRAMYGKGMYFAESSTKADEYARDEPDGYYNGTFALVLSRVCLGKFYHTTEREPNANSKTLSGEFDSTCGDRKASVNTFREFVVYSGDQVYPEFVVLYQRILHTTDTTLLRLHAEARLFQLQLPAYWQNWHRDPSKESFKLCVAVDPFALRCMQRLVDACLGAAGGKQVTVVRARRIEDSAMWTAYMDFKNRVVNRRSGRCCTPIARLDGDPEGGGSALMQTLMEEAQSEGGISLMDAVDERVNERLLWHGTTAWAAEAIADVGFKASIAALETTYDQPFGPGSYLTDDLKKSLEYAPDSGANIHQALWCRALCGDIYYTESAADGQAVQKRALEEKDSVLANPGKAGRREFVFPNAAQLYPEYIVEFQYVRPSASI